jgi:hypothetical protein
MITSHIENEVIEFEIHGDIPEIVCEILVMISCIHRVFLKTGKEAAAEFRIGLLSMINDEEVLDVMYSPEGLPIKDGRIMITAT